MEIRITDQHIRTASHRDPIAHPVCLAARQRWKQVEKAFLSEDERYLTLLLFSGEEKYYRIDSNAHDLFTIYRYTGRLEPMKVILLACKVLPGKAGRYLRRANAPDELPETVEILVQDEIPYLHRVRLRWEFIRRYYYQKGESAHGHG